MILFNQKRRIRKMAVMAMAAFMFLGACIPAEAAGVTTEAALLPVSYSEAYTKVNVNTMTGTKTYNVFNQKMFGRSKRDYIPAHGCAVCSLTTVLSGCRTAYTAYTPEMTRKILEKKVFGKSAWKRNYRKSARGQMPLSLYGISRILKKCGVSNRYVSSFSSDKKVEMILKKHLMKGMPVVIETNNHRQKNGRISSKYDIKWAGSRHTMVLLGMSDQDKVIVADSATRKWAGRNQRIKLADLSDLIAHMIPHSPSGKSFYYNGNKCYSGYILVNN